MTRVKKATALAAILRAEAPEVPHDLHALAEAMKCREGCVSGHAEKGQFDEKAVSPSEGDEEDDS